MKFYECGIYYDVTLTQPYIVDMRECTFDGYSNMEDIPWIRKSRMYSPHRKFFLSKKDASDWCKQAREYIRKHRHNSNLIHSKYKVG